MAIHRAPQESAGGGRRIVSVGLPIVLVVAIVAVVAFFLNEPAQTTARDRDLCPVDAGAVSERAVLLLDLGKPWNEDAAELLAETIGEVAAGLGADAELRVFALSGTAAEPRQSLDRLCKPYDERELAAGEGCGNLPAELAEREAAMQFCTRSETLQRRVGRSAARRQGASVANAYLVEAIEETSLEFAAASGPKSLFILSDMVQHAPWYSQAVRGAASLSFSEFERLRGDQSRLVGPRPAPLADVDVTIFYVPRTGVTADSMQRREHKRFWQEYVADAFTTAPIFHELPTMPSFEAAPFPDLAAVPELSNAEWESLQREREEAERLLEVVERERVALEEARVAALERAEQLEAEAERRELAAAAAIAAAEAEAEQRRREAAAAELAAAERAAAELAAANTVAQQPIGTSPEALSSPAPANLALADQEAAGSSASASESADLAADLRQDAESTTPPPPPTSEPQPPPLPLSQPESPTAATVVDAATGGSATPCPLTLKPRFQGAQPEYPRRARQRFGEATITVSYVVDEQGDTVDAAVAIVEAQSTARPEQFFDMFASQASAFVQRLEFDFEADAACVRRQAATTTFQFNYR